MSEDIAYTLHLYTHSTAHDMHVSCHCASRAKSYIIIRLYTAAIQLRSTRSIESISVSISQNFALHFTLITVQVNYAAAGDGAARVGPEACCCGSALVKPSRV